MLLSILITPRWIVQNILNHATWHSNLCQNMLIIIPQLRAKYASHDCLLSLTKSVCGRNTLQLPETTRSIKMSKFPAELMKSPQVQYMHLSHSIIPSVVSYFKTPPYAFNKFPKRSIKSRAVATKIDISMMIFQRYNHYNL